MCSRTRGDTEQVVPQESQPTAAAPPTQVPHLIARRDAGVRRQAKVEPRSLPEGIHDPEDLRAEAGKVSAAGKKGGSRRGTGGHYSPQLHPGCLPVARADPAAGRHRSCTCKERRADQWGCPTLSHWAGCSTHITVYVAPAPGLPCASPPQPGAAGNSSHKGSFFENMTRQRSMRGGPHTNVGRMGRENPAAGHWTRPSAALATPTTCALEPLALMTASETDFSLPMTKAWSASDRRCASPTERSSKSASTPHLKRACPVSISARRYQNSVCPTCARGRHKGTE
jgi:hypothetical protein